MATIGATLDLEPGFLLKGVPERPRATGHTKELGLAHPRLFAKRRQGWAETRTKRRRLIGTEGLSLARAYRDVIILGLT